MVNTLSLPEALVDEENVLKLLTIIFPCTIKKVDPENRKEERAFFLKIFRENSAIMRSKFFSDPLVKYLWEQIFIN